MLKLGIKTKCVLYMVLLLVIIYILFPVFVGEDSIISIHDNLDSNAGWAKMIKDNNLFFTLNAPTQSFDNLPISYYMMVNYSLYSAIFCLLPTFSAYMINYFITVIVGFVSMFILLRKIEIEDDFIAVVISITFALLPRFYWAAVAISSIPILIIVFLDILKQKSVFNKKYLLLFFFPLISSLPYAGMFALGAWFLASIILSIRSKKININLFIVFLVLCIGYILVEFKLFYHALVIKEPLNRSIFALGDGRVLLWFKNYFLNGWYHFTSLQRKIIIPFVFIFLVLYFLSFWVKRIKKQFEYINRKNIRIILFLFCILISFSFIAALYENNSISTFVETILPPLSGFNWGRIWVLNIPVWYILFAFVLVQINILFKKKWLGYFVVLLQLAYVLVIPTAYNDTVKTWYNELFYKTGIDQKIGINKSISKKISDISDDFISFREFFDVKLFDKIKKEINYKNEKVVAFGYHPSVLMYNNFHCVDGYSNVIPLSYMRQFGSLLEPEFAVNHEMRDYYNSWGGRMYLYNGGHNFYEPTRDKNPKPATLRVDMNILKDTFNVKYILSRVEISNAAELRLHLLGSYTHNNSIYTIHVYEVL